MSTHLWPQFSNICKYIHSAAAAAAAAAVTAVLSEKDCFSRAIGVRARDYLDENALRELHFAYYIFHCDYLYTRRGYHHRIYSFAPSWLQLHIQYKRLESSSSSTLIVCIPTRHVSAAAAAAAAALHRIAQAWKLRARYTSSCSCTVNSYTRAASELPNYGAFGHTLEFPATALPQHKYVSVCVHNVSRRAYREFYGAAAASEAEAVATSARTIRSSCVGQHNNRAMVHAAARRIFCEIRIQKSSDEKNYKPKGLQRADARAQDGTYNYKTITDQEFTLIISLYFRRQFGHRRVVCPALARLPQRSTNDHRLQEAVRAGLGYINYITLMAESSYTSSRAARRYLIHYGEAHTPYYQSRPEGETRWSAITCSSSSSSNGADSRHRPSTLTLEQDFSSAVQCQLAPSGIDSLTSLLGRRRSKKKGNTNASFSLRPHPIIYRRSSSNSSRSSRNSSNALCLVCRDLRRCAYYDNYKATSFIYVCIHTETRGVAKSHGSVESMIATIIRACDDEYIRERSSHARAKRPRRPIYIQTFDGPRSVNRTDLNNDRRRAGTNPRRKPHHIGATNTIKRRNLQRRRTKLTRVSQRNTTREKIKQKWPLVRDAAAAAHDTRLDCVIRARVFAVHRTPRSAPPHIRTLYTQGRSSRTQLFEDRRAYFIRPRVAQEVAQMLNYFGRAKMAQTLLALVYFLSTTIPSTGSLFSRTKAPVRTHRDPRLLCCYTSYSDRTRIKVLSSRTGRAHPSKCERVCLCVCAHFC
ncbi:unnamed protein product [Trichogramma brassicae]|uniref:Uncharacterized protein n=1 Tax=Trichogramma brassicae TaxID=86971 RepID=A0A6H5I432_9HYME|nr:unnamed protein product [Trichogramma brassicae]